MQTTNTRKKPSALPHTAPRAARRNAPESASKPKAPVQDAAYFRAMADGYFSFWFEGDA